MHHRTGRGERDHAVMGDDGLRQAAEAVQGAGALIEQRNSVGHRLQSKIGVSKRANMVAARVQQPAARDQGRQVARLQGQREAVIRQSTLGVSEHAARNAPVVGKQESSGKLAKRLAIGIPRTLGVPRLLATKIRHAAHRMSHAVRRIKRQLCRRRLQQTIPVTQGVQDFSQADCCLSPGFGIGCAIPGQDPASVCPLL